MVPAALGSMDDGIQPVAAGLEFLSTPRRLMKHWRGSGTCRFQPLMIALCFAIFQGPSLYKLLRHLADNQKAHLVSATGGILAP